MNSDHLHSLWLAVSLAAGIFLSGCLSVPLGAFPLLIVAALLLLVSFGLLRRGVGALFSIVVFFVLLGYFRGLLPDLSLLPERVVAWSGQLSSSLVESLSRLRLSPTTTSLLQGMLLGQRRLIAPELQELYRQSGAAHILALSGLHLTIIFGLLNYVFIRLLVYRVRYVLGLLAIGLIWTYALLTGFPLSLCRASLMMTLLIVGQMLQSGGSSWHTLGLTALLLLFFTPSAFYDVGFQLSFVAVAGILLFYPPLSDIGLPSGCLLRPLWQTFLVSLAAQLAVMPLLLHYFHRMSFIGLFLSPVHVLLATGIMYVALLLWVLSPVGLGFLLRISLEWLVALQHGLMSLTASLPLSTVSNVRLPWLGVFMWYAALLCLLPPLRALREPDIPLQHIRMAYFFRTWPYVLSAIVYGMGVWFVMGKG